jgi:predicted kinase
MVGAPGSGKSSWANKVVEHCPDANIVSRDKVRFSMITEKDDYFSKEKEVFNEFISQIVDSVKHHQITIVDATHMNKKGRNKVFNRLTSTLENVTLKAIVMNTTLETCLERNAQREGLALVPESAIARMYEGFEMPTEKEGFEQIVLIDEDWKEQYLWDESL